MTSNKPKGFELALFIFVLALTSFFVYFSKQSSLNTTKETLTSVAQTQFQAILQASQMSAERFYDDHSHNIAQYMAKALNASPSEKALIRDQLLDEYQTFYDNSRNKGLGVLHLFEKDGTSLLRFHRPREFGDNTIQIRESVNQLVHHQRYTQGLEIGRFREAYRFVFPLFYNGQFVGGMEYSLDFSILRNQLAKQFGGEYQQFLLKDAIAKHTFKDEETNYYQPSTLDEKFLIAKKHALYQVDFAPYINEIKTTANFQEQMASKQAFTVLFNHQSTDMSATFMPLFNTKQDFIGYLLSIHAFKNNEISTLHNQMWIELISLWTLLTLLFLAWRKQAQSTHLIRQILDAQPTMVALSENNKLQFANKTLLNFLGYSDYTAFTQKHDCVCDVFEKDEHFLQKNMQNQLWTDYLNTHPKGINKVKIKNPTTQKMHIFEVTIQQVKNHHINNLITFNDITVIESEKADLKKENQQDKLTGAYNRRGFDILYHEINESFNPKLSLIMLDIDYFKVINDQFGHQTGDHILEALSALISANLREEDAFIRWGGEEFIILLQNTDLKTATLIANKLKTAISQHTFTKVKKLTCSFGVTQHLITDTQESIVKRADQALYRAKKEGRNRVISR
ncbi:MAG: diguanylate cyclase [Thiotrichales bacterium]|nr:diguanylate cyclase [Thiotrichales bacterium]